MAEIIAFRYTGNGAHRPMVPARDLDADDLVTTAAAQKRTVAELVAEALVSGLYQPVFDVEPEPVDEQLEAQPWDGLTKKQLVALATERGLEVDPKATNAVLRDALIASFIADETASAVADPEPEADPLP